MSVLHLSTGAAVESANPWRSSKLFMKGVVKEMTRFGTLYSKLIQILSFSCGKQDQTFVVWWSRRQISSSEVGEKHCIWFQYVSANPSPTTFARNGIGKKWRLKIEITFLIRKAYYVSSISTYIPILFILGFDRRDDCFLYFRIIKVML